MKVQGSTELSRLLTLQRNSGETRSALDRASQEMSTGLKASKYKATGGNLSRLYSLERLLERTAVHEHAIGLTETKLELMQLGLQKAEERSNSIAVDMLAATGLNDISSAQHHAEASRQAFRDLVATLNLQVGGEALFAGTATDGAAVLPADDILAQIDGLVTGLSASDAIQAVSDYFAGVGTPTFATDAYLGTADDLAPVEVGDGTRIDYSVRATDAKLVEALKGHALGAIVAKGGAFENGGNADRLTILKAAGQTLLAARNGLLALSSQTGSAQEAVESAKAQRTAEKETYDLARNKILAADPYETATMFEAMKNQLESVFTVTARLGTLRFANFLR